MPRVWIGLLAGMLELGALTMPLTKAAAAGGTVVAWGGNYACQSTPGVTNVVAIAAGNSHSLFLMEDSTVAACGWHYDWPYSNPFAYPIVVPSGLTNVIAIAGGDAHSLALKADGTVVAWGINTSGQTNVPLGLSNVVAISAGARHSMALQADGTVVAWGSSGFGTGRYANAVAIAAGGNNSLVLLPDGRAFGGPGVNTNLAGLSNIVAISAGDNGQPYGYESWLALQANGVVVSGSSFGGTSFPASNAVAISASRGTDHHISLALMQNGTVAGWGFNFYASQGQPLVPAGLANVVAVASGDNHNLALLGAGPPFLLNRLRSRTGVMTGNSYFRVEATGARPLSYQWLFNGTNLLGATDSVLALTNLHPNHVGSYSVRVSNAFGATTCESVQLTSLAPLNIITQPRSQTTFAGSTATFGIAVQGIEPLNYQWQMDGSDIAGATNSMLVLTNLQLNQAGLYSVMVTNAFGSIVSSAAALTVVPFLFTSQPQDQIRFIGGTAEFSVTAQGAQPIYYQWQFNDADLAGATNSSLTFTNLRQAHAGLYSVTLSNAFGSAKSFDATLSIVVIAAWGNSDAGQNVPENLINVIAIAAGNNHSLALMADGTVAEWGLGSGGTGVPAGLTNVVAIARSHGGSLALKDDGTVVSWGNNPYYQQPASLSASLTNVVAAAGGSWHVLALRADGRVVAWGYVGLTNVPADLTNVVAVSAGQEHNLALKPDGTVRAWGDNGYGQTNVPAGLTNAIAIAAGDEHNLALRADGTVVAWGYNFNGQTNVPTGLTNAVAIAAGFDHNLALRADGTVVAWGGNFNDQTNVPAGLTNVAAIAAGFRHSLALIDAPPLLRAPLGNPAWESNGFSVSVPTQSGRVYRLEYKNSLTDTNWISLPLVAGNGASRTLSDPSAAGAQRFYRVRRW